MAMQNVTKITVNLPDEIVEFLEQTATERNTTFTQVMRQMLENQKFLSEQIRSGAKVLLQTSDGSLQQIIFR